MADANIILNAVGVIGTILALLLAIFVWYINSKNKITETENKRKQELYTLKEENYAKLIRNVIGLDRNLKNFEMEIEFLNQCNICWLFGSDEVINAANKFIIAYMTGTNPQNALGELMLAVRKDLINNEILNHTNLTADDFKLIVPEKRDN